MKPKATFRLNVYRIIDDAVERGIAYGWGRAHKHTNQPDEGTLLQAIQDAVMSELSEVVRWDDDV